MNKDSKRIVIWVAVALSGLVFLPIVSGNATTFYTDWLWYDSVGQLDVLETRILSRVLLWGLGAGIVVVFLILNWLVLPKRLFGPIQLRVGGKGGRPSVTISPRLLRVVVSGVVALITLTMASSAAGQWMTVLRFRHATVFDLSDPIFGLDASFFVFKLPFYRYFLGWAMGLVVLTIIGNALMYVFAGRVRKAEAIGHLSVLGALFLAGRAVSYLFKRWALVESSAGVVSGAGYTDVNARMPLFLLMAIVVAAGAVLLVVNIFIRRWRLLLYVGGAWLALVLIGEFYPAAVQRFTVEPNELALERPYIEHNIRLTRHAYGLTNVLEYDYKTTDELTPQEAEDNSDTLRNVRLWDWQPLRSTYEQIQEIRTYYTFNDVDIDRYIIDGQLRQVNLAVRELDIEQMREDARTWINKHLIYTHGYGLCLSPVSEVSEEGLPRLLVRNIPPETESPSLEIDRPEIYFGERSSDYVVINTSEDEFDYPSGDANVYSRYEGDAGVPMGGLLRRLAFALRFNSTPILLSEAIRPDSRILFHRVLGDRVEMVAPMLWLDPDPYAVIADGRIVWLYDTYTWTDRFPYSRSTRGLNYIRNSVKVTIDAYSGEMTFYVVDPDDPLVQTYRSIFPGLFAPVEEMDPALREHWRYPEQLFLIQADLYGAYHVEDPRVFYNQEDLWETPMEVRGSESTPISPYYVTMRLPDTDEVGFIMMRPYVPAGKQNMISWLYADSDGSDYGQLGIYKFSKDSLVYGPMQIESRIDQDPRISEQLTLWNQRGSSVNRGNLIVIPINGSLLYVEPIYLQAEASRIPELKRVIVAYQNRVAMADSFSAGLAQVLGQRALTEVPGQEAGDGDRDGGTGEPPTGVAALAQSAQSHYEAAQACLERGDWTCYGDELEMMEQDLQALVDATAE